jgi:hypothetical protein
MSGLGKQHESKPVLPRDKVMSKRHLAHRAELDNMANSKDKIKKSIKYNKQHMKEHQKALKAAAKELEKQYG